jgi:hypothetical protein
VSELPPPPEPPPSKTEKPAAEAKPPEVAPVIDDTMQNDPLIQSALVKFQGKVLA